MKKLSLLAGSSALVVYLVMSLCASLYASQMAATKAQNDLARTQKIADDIGLEGLHQQVEDIVHKAGRHGLFKAKIR